MDIGSFAIRVLHMGKTGAHGSVLHCEAEELRAENFRTYEPVLSRKNSWRTLTRDWTALAQACPAWEPQQLQAFIEREQLQCMLSAYTSGTNWKTMLARSAGIMPATSHAVLTLKCILMRVLRHTVPSKLEQVKRSDPKCKNIQKVRVILGLSHSNSPEGFQTWARANISLLALERTPAVVRLDV